MRLYRFINAYYAMLKFSSMCVLYLKSHVYRISDVFLLYLWDFDADKDELCWNNISVWKLTSIHKTSKPGPGWVLVACVNVIFNRMYSTGLKHKYVSESKKDKYGLLVLRKWQSAISMDLV